jgi:hypothetical protein
MQQQQQRVSDNQQQLMSDSHLQALLSGLTAQLQHAKPQNVANTLLACARLRFVPRQLLAALDDSQLLEKLLSGMEPQALSNSVWLCGQLGYRSGRLPGAFLQLAASHLQQQLLLPLQGQQHRLNTQNLSNLCWSATVLDLQQCAPDVLLLVRAASQQWDTGVATETLQQLHQVHLWLLDCRLPATPGQQGPSGCLTAQQLQQCRASWEQRLDVGTAVADASRLQRSVFSALQQLPASTW